jgi:hypothetical protein
MQKERSDPLVSARFPLAEGARAIEQLLIAK